MSWNPQQPNNPGQWPPPGAPPSYPPPMGYPPAPGPAGPGGPGYGQTSGMATASFVFGIIAITLILDLFLIPAILAIVFGVIARSQIRESGGALEGAKKAKTGITLGIIAIAIAVVAIVILIVVAATNQNSTALGLLR